MSADDFQTKYASVMESMLKSAIAETTKLFETMVDELKEEISNIRKENEDLKTRCTLYEIAKSQPIGQTKERDPAAEQSDALEKCDTAVQCDLVPCRTVLVEQCQPLRHSALQNQEMQCASERVDYSLQEHNYVSYGDRNSKMALLLVKQEESYSDSSLQYALKQEEIEPPVASGQFISNNSGSEEASVRRAESKESMIVQECSAEEMNSPQKAVETQVVLNLACLGGSQNVQYQSSDPQHSLVISLKDALREDIKEEWEGGQKLAEMQEEPTMSEKAKLVPEECHQDDAASLNEQTEVIVQQHADVHCTDKELAKSMLVNNEVTSEYLKDAVREGEGSPKLNLSSQRRRGQPQVLSLSTEVPKGLEGINAPSVREEGAEVSPAVSSSMSSEASPAEPLETSSIITSTVHETANKKKGEVGSPPVSVESLSSSNMPTQAESQPPSSAVEEDATEAQSYGGSTVSRTPNSTQAELLQVASGPLKEHHTSVSLQDAMLLVEAMNQSTVAKAVSLPQSTDQPKTQHAPLVGTLEAVTEIPAAMQTRAPPVETLLTAKTQDVAPQSATSSSYAQAENKVVVPKQQHALTPLQGGGSSTIKSVILSAAATQTTQESLPRPLITLGAPSNAPRTIIIVPRPGQPNTCNKVTGVSSPMCSKGTLTAAQNNLLPPSKVEKLPLGAHPRSSVSRKTIKVTYNKLLPIIPLQSSAVLTDESLEPSPHQKITISPRQVSAEALAKPISLTVKQGATEPSAPAPVGSLTWMETHDSSPSFFDESILSDKMDESTEYIESSKQTTSVSETNTFPTGVCSSSEMSVGQGPTPLSSVLPSSADLKLSPVVRLQRLPFPVSTKESVFVSRLSEGFSDCITQNSSNSTILHSGMSVTSSVNPLCVSEIPEGSSILEESPINRDVQPYLSSSVSETVLVKSPVASNTTVPLPEPTSVREVIPHLNQEIISSVVQENPTDGLLRPTSITSKDTCDPHLQMTKTQFLAQLSVSPVVQAVDKESSTDNSADVTETRTSRRKRLQKNAIVAGLRSHLKTHLEAKRAATEETDAEMVYVAKSSKKPRLEKDNLINESSACSTKSDETENITSDTIRSTTSFVSRRRPGLSQDVSAKTTVGQPASVGSSTSESTSDSTAVSFGEPGSVTDCVGTNNNNSTSLSPEQFNSTKESTSPKKTKLASVSLSRSSSDGVHVSSRNKRSSSVSPMRPSSVEDGASLQMTRDNSSPKSTKCTSPCPKRLMREVTSPKKTESPCVGLRKSTLSRNSTSPKVSGPSNSSTFIKVSHYSKSIKRESSSFSPGRYSLSTESVKNIKCHEMKCPKTPGASTPAMKHRSIQGRPALKTNFKVANALKLAKAAKAKRRPKMKTSNKLKRQKRPLAENQVNLEVKKCRAKVWYPPTLPPNEVPSTEFRKPPPAKVEDKVPLIPFNQSPIVSPLQPLAVIGKHLLRNQCGQCGRIFSSSPALESHVSLHAGHRPFSCSLCGKSFPDSKSFKRHGRVHRNGRIHICRHCGKGFVYRFGLTKHQQMVHGRLKPFVCQICSKGFFTKRDVEVHIRIHTGEKPFHCHLCEKKFTRRVELNVHLRWHNGEKRHWCSYCGKGFLDFNNLKRHKYTHTGEKPHTCPHCPKKFTQTGHLKKHLKNVHHDE